MRHNKNIWLNKIAVAILFLLLQGIAIFLMTRYSVTQQAGIVHSLNVGHYYLWERQQMMGKYFNLNTVNRELSEENMRLRTELLTYQTHTQHTSPFDTIFSCINAEVVQKTTSSLQNYLIINRGSNHGVEADMGVIGNQGVVGIVRDVSPHFSRVISLLNTNLPISARIEPEGATGFLTWDGRSIYTGTISDMPQHSAIAVGDTAFTSGYSQIFPPHIPLGVVTSTTIAQGTFLEAKIRFFQNFNTLRYVYVIKNMHRQEIDDLILMP